MEHDSDSIKAPTRPLTEQEARALDLIMESVRESCAAPTLSQLAQQLEVSDGRVHQLLTEMEAKGYISRPGGQRVIQVHRNSHGQRVALGWVALDALSWVRVSTATHCSLGRQTVVSVAHDDLGIRVRTLTMEWEPGLAQWVPRDVRVETFSPALLKAERRSPSLGGAP